MEKTQYQFRKYSLSIVTAFLVAGCNASGSGTMPRIAATPIPSGAPITPPNIAVPSSPVPTPVTLPVGNSLLSVSVIDDASTPYAGIANSGAIPTNGTGAAITLTNASQSISAVRGGTAMITFSTPNKPTALLVGIPGVDGVYTVDLTAQSAAVSTQSIHGTTWRYQPNTNLSVEVSSQREIHTQSPNSFNYTVLLDVPTDLNISTLNVSFVAVYNGTSSSSMSSVANVTMNLVAAGNASGSFQAQLVWRKPVDIDLHVLPPNGQEIGYNDRSGLGGSLDVDSNPDCNIDNIDIENITWAGAVAPSGIYRIRPDYYNNCNIPDPISYNLTIRTSDTLASSSHLPAKYSGIFTAGEADYNAVNAAHLIYIGLLPSPTTDEGLIDRLILAEIGNPSSSGYIPSDADKAAQAIRAIVENRKIAPGTFGAVSSSTHDIVFAPGQFAGFTAGTIDQSILNNISGILTPLGVQQTSVSTTWIPFWNSVFSAATESYSEHTNDPYATLTQVGGQAVSGGTYGVRTAGHTGPGGNFVFAGTLDGQNFYTLKAGVVPTQ